MILVACKRCNRTFAYGDRTKADCLCPDCENGPFDQWFVEVATEDELMTDGGRSLHTETDRSSGTGGVGR